MNNDNFIYAYLRASTKNQDATRAKKLLIDFVAKYERRIAAFFVENASGAKLERVELNKLIEQAQEGDILLIEAIDRLSRLPFQEWETLKSKLSEKKIRLVSLDVPTSHMFLSTENNLTDAITLAINNMLIDTLAAIAHQNYITYRCRQIQGIEKAKKRGAYKGRPADVKKHAQIVELLNHGYSYTKIGELLDVSKSTILRVKKANREKLTQCNDLFLEKLK